jgi:hypothetical protein
MPFMVLRRRAVPILQAKGCALCGKTSDVLHHYTRRGGIKAAAFTHGYQDRFLSREQDYTEEAFCCYGCCELMESRKIPVLAPHLRPKRPF